MKNLYISAAEYDYHTLLKVAEMAGLAGIVINDYKSRLKDLENNIWMH